MEKAQEKIERNSEDETGTTTNIVINVELIEWL